MTLTNIPANSFITEAGIEWIARRVFTDDQAPLRLYVGLSSKHDSTQYDRQFAGEFVNGGMGRARGRLTAGRAGAALYCKFKSEHGASSLRRAAIFEKPVSMEPLWICVFGESQDLETGESLVIEWNFNVNGKDYVVVNTEL